MLKNVQAETLQKVLAKFFIEPYNVFDREVQIYPEGDSKI